MNLLNLIPYFLRSWISRKLYRLSRRFRPYDYDDDMPF